MNDEELQLLPLGASEGSILGIAYRFREPKGNKPVFIWFCGFRSEMGSLKAQALADWASGNDAGCLRFDYSGHGRSGGRFEDGTVGSWLAEAAAICKIASPSPTVFVGSSMGACIALLLALRRSPSNGAPVSPASRYDIIPPDGHPPKALTLIAPAWDMTRLMWQRAPENARAVVLRDGVYYRPSAYGDGPYPITKKLLDDGEKYLLGEAPIALDCPVRILHGCLDPDVPWRRSLDLLNLLSGSDVRLTLVKDGEHRLSRPQDLALLFATLSEFL
jgi:pimeloyl-ACP methyl ester carboxylesterase